MLSHFVSSASGPIWFLGAPFLPYVFLKPHAVTEPCKKLVATNFAKAGITVYKEGTLDGATIEKDKLIDNHYYAIANKASLSKPAELNPPASRQQEVPSQRFKSPAF